jgi:hypothetical protein
LSTYDEDRLTHIITGGWYYETVKSVNAILKDHFKPVSQIPLRIKILSWSWVADCVRSSRFVEPDKTGYIHTYRWEKGQALLGIPQPLPRTRIQRKPREREPPSSEEEERRA